MKFVLCSLLALPLLAAFLPVRIAPDDVYEADIAYLLDAFEEQAGVLLEQKDIDWKKVRKEFTKAAKSIDNNQDHIELCARLLARLQDGHARFTRVDVDMSDRSEGRTYGCGLELVEFGKKIYVKRAFGSAESAGIKAGWEVTKIGGEKAAKWFDQRVQSMTDSRGYSSVRAARWTICTWGLTGVDGERLKFEFIKGKKGKKKSTMTFSRQGGEGRLSGPVVYPDGLETVGRDIAWTTLPSGYGYILVGRVPGDLHELFDKALEGMGDMPGLILDFRSNVGGGYDRDALLGRFVPEGESWGGEASAGPNPYGGPLVVLIDPATISAGETIVGELKEEGRAFLIGPDATHGASGSKATISPPSGLFELRFVIRSNKQRFNGGKGVEGIGIAPDEVVPYDPELLLEGVDPCIARAVELLTEPLPKKAVSFIPLSQR